MQWTVEQGIIVGKDLHTNMIRLWFQLAPVGQASYAHYLALYHVLHYCACYVIV